MHNPGIAFMLHIFLLLMRCLCIGIHSWIHAYICTSTNLYMHTCIYIYLQVCRPWCGLRFIHACTCIHASMWLPCSGVHVCMNVSIPHISVCAQIHAYKSDHTNVERGTCINLNMQACPHRHIPYVYKCHICIFIHMPHSWWPMCIQISLCGSMFMCKQAFIYVHISTFIYVPIHVCIQAHTQDSMNMYMWIKAHVYMCTCVYACTHAQTMKGALRWQSESINDKNIVTVPSISLVGMLF